MRTFKRIAGFIIVNLVVVVSLTFMLAQPSVLKILLKEAKNAECDTLIIGESHGETSYDPYVMSDVTGNQVFNLSRRLMPVANLCYIMEEANVNGQYKRVILDLDPSYWDDDHRGTFGSDTNLLFRLTGNRWVDYIKNILVKDNYNDTLTDYYVSTMTVKRIPQNLKCKLNKAYLTGDESSIQNTYSIIGAVGSFEYKGRGFRYGLKKSGVEWPSWNFDKDSIKQENIDAFKKIAKYCKDNDIELVCVQSALPPYRLQNENMDEVHEYFTELCSEYNVPFYDLNYLKNEYLSRTDDDYVDLDGHMMGELADRQSAVLGQILISENKEAFFYDNFSGSVMPASCLSVWQQNLPDAKFVNQYGPTEATASCTYYKVDHLVSQDEQLPIGRPYNNYRVFLLNEDLTETQNGEIGEICVSGPTLALGYYNDSERTEKSFIINPNYKGYPERMYRTGDYGRIREDGLLEFHGRMDRQVKHMGHRVELDEIEYAANQIAGVDECVSLYNKEKEVLYLFYSGETAMRQVVLELRKVLPGFMVPRKVKQVSALPKLASGKIDMTTLKEEM